MEDRLHKFAVLVEEGSFTRAAETLRISQPALSSSIRKLEHELKQQLLDHGAHPLKLTVAGEYAYTAAKQIHISTSNLRLKLEQLNRQKPHVAIGMIDSVAQAIFAYGATFADIERHARLSLIVDNSRNLTEAVRRNELDVAFAVEPVIRPVVESLTYHAVGTEPLLVVCHRSIYASIARAMRRGHLSPFIGYDQSSNTYRLISQAFTRAGIRLTPTFYSSSPAVILQLVAARKGAAGLPYLTAQELLAARQIVPLPIAKSYVVKRPITLMAQQGKQLPPFLLAAIEQVRTTLQQLESEVTQIDNKNSSDLLLK